MIIPSFDDYSAQQVCQTTTYSDSFIDTKLFSIDFSNEIDFSNLEQQQQPIYNVNNTLYTTTATVPLDTNDQSYIFNQNDFFELPVTLSTDYNELDTNMRIVSDDYETKSYSSMNPIKACQILQFNYDFSGLEDNSINQETTTYENQDYSIVEQQTINTGDDVYIVESSDMNITEDNFDFIPYVISSSCTSNNEPVEICQEQNQVFESFLEESHSSSSSITLSSELSSILLEDDANILPYIVDKPSEDLKKKCKEHLIEMDRQKRTRKCSHLWQFCACLLDDEIYNPSLIKWLNMDEGIFKIVEPERVAELWGAQKTRRFDKKMTYEKMARGMRYSRSEGFFKKLDKQKNKPNEYGKQFVFQFSDKVVQNFVWKTKALAKD